jgi:hypothetical protein
MGTLSRVTAVMVLIVALWGCSSIQQGLTLSGSVSGQVQLVPTGITNNAGVLVQLMDGGYRVEQNTTANGRFSFVGLPQALYKLTCSKAQYVTLNIEGIDLLQQSDWSNQFIYLAPLSPPPPPLDIP